MNSINSVNFKIPEFVLQSSEIVKNKLIFENGNQGFDKSLKDGFFLVKMPENIDITPGDKFAQNFYLPKQDSNKALADYQGYNIYTPDKFNAPHEGYYLRERDQTEQFFLEKRFWEEIYPKDLVKLANQLNELALTILFNILEYVGIPSNLWDKATGEATANNGTHHLTFNHFRPEKDARGLNIHKDSGWITVLRSQEPGLEAFINKQWYSISPKPGYFIMNFGCAMEILTKNLEKPVSAIVHRVVKQGPKGHNLPDRFSYALFTDNSLNESISKGLYTYTEQTGLVLKTSFNKFLTDILQNTYKEETVGLYDE